MCNYNATLYIDITHWDVSAVVLVLVLFTRQSIDLRNIKQFFSETLNNFMTSIRGNNEVEVKIENTMHNYNVTLAH